MAQQLNLYGSQPTPMPGQANVGYGPGGQHYNMLNPVVQTSSGVVPASVYAASMNQMRQQRPPGGGSKPGGGTQRQPYAWTAAGRALAAQGGQQGSGNPLLDMLGGGNVNTSIAPQNIYSPQQTDEAVNQAVASSSMPLPWLQNQFAGRGMSVNSPATISRAMVPYAQGLSQGQNAMAQIPLQDITANAQHWSAGEQARENEGLDWVRLLTSSQGLNQNARLNTLQSVLGMLGSFV
jgi:hypothetical protein